MMYRMKTRSIKERKELIEKGLKSPEGKHPFHEFQNILHHLPIIRIGIDVPVYRMLNYRTRTAQLGYIHERKESEDFFSSGQENEAVQLAQHDILVDYAKKGRAESIVPIFDALRKEEQHDPLIITSCGVVVNGNRRLAAMRELFAENSGDFSNFSHVNCAVLPESATLEDIREIEVRLQMRLETKLPYEWVNESFAIRELLNSDKSHADIAKLMNKKKRDVELADQALTEVDIYLDQWTGTPGAYQDVEDGEQFFSDLAKGLAKKQGEDLEVSRRFAWALFQAKQNLNRRVYDYKFSFSDRTEEVAKSLAARLGVELTPQDESGDRENEDDLDINIDEEKRSISFAPLIAALDDTSQRKKGTKDLVDICDGIIEMNRQGEIGNRALAAVESANNKLQEVDLGRAYASTYGAIDSQLDSVIERAKKLKKELPSCTSG